MNEHTPAFFTTKAENGKPWTRYVVIKTDDQMNIWFATFKNLRKMHQIAKNPQVHPVLDVTDPQTAVSWLQVQGRAEILENAETKKYEKKRKDKKIDIAAFGKNSRERLHAFGMVNKFLTNTKFIKIRHLCPSLF